MASWDIDPVGVKGVLGRVETHANDLATAASDVSTDFELCADAIGGSIVTQALSDFASARAPELKNVATRISGAMKGTVQAVTDYMHGNLTMAKHAQAAAAQAGSPAPTTTGPGPVRHR